jgi:hypothetical protein
LKENFNKQTASQLDLVISRLKSTTNKNQDPYEHQYALLDDLMLKLGIKEIGSGASRAAYSNQNDFYVIKIALDEEGIIANNSEVEISKRKHGAAAQDIFLNLYAYDELNTYPMWLICEKVLPIVDIKDVDILKKVFPTFDRITNGLINDTFWFTLFISNVCSSIALSSGRPADLGAGFESLEKKEKYNLMFPGVDFKRFKENVVAVWEYEFNRDKSLLDLEYTKPGEDIIKLFNGLSIVATTDLHKGNIAIRQSSNPSPEDIIILDFDFEN